MIVAIALAHVGRVRVRKATDSESKHKRALIFFGLSLPSSDSPSFSSSFGSSGGLGRPVISLTFARISPGSGLSPTQAWVTIWSGPTMKTARRA